MQSRRRIGPYRVLRRLGSGGMGSVYLALDDHGRTVAVKVIHPHVAEDEHGLRRLAREAAAGKRVRSPYVAELLDTNLLATEPYLVTRYVQGLSLQQIVKERGPLKGQLLRSLGVGLAAALDAIHGAGVVHRDITPRNIMMANGIPVVIDFGISQIFDATRITQSFIGTPGYVAPEVILGRRAAPAADVFSWAATMVFAASGRSCFEGETIVPVLHRTLHEEPDLGGLPPDLVPVVHRALRKDPAKRPNTQALVGAISTFSPDSQAPLAPPVHRSAALGELAGQRETEPLENRLSDLWIGAGQARSQGNHPEATRRYMEVLRIAARSGDRQSEMFASYQLGLGAEAHGEHSTADNHYIRARQLAAAEGCPNIEILALRGLERIAYRRGDTAAAQDYQRRGRQVLEEKQGQGYSLSALEQADKYLRRMRRRPPIRLTHLTDTAPAEPPA